MNFRDLVLLLSLKTSHCAKVFLRYWIAVFGAPNKVFSDNGGEFVGEAFHEMCERFNIKIQTTTPAYSPGSNGVCERHNQTLTTILLKIKDDVKCDYETALAWALSAKNSLSNNNGYSPTQLILGKNANLSNFIENNLPAQEPSTKSFHIATNLQLYMLLEKLLLNPSRVTN